MRQVRRVHEDHQMKCKCHPDSPFRWMHNQRPSIFAQDVFFRAKNVVATTNYKSFGIYLRANPSVKPQLNKYEL
jgi:hypothetical protein